MLLQVYSEISMVGRNPSKHEQEDVYRMPLLLATIYESARLLPSGHMLQRCSIKHGEKIGKINVMVVFFCSTQRLWLYYVLELIHFHYLFINVHPCIRLEICNWCNHTCWNCTGCSCSIGTKGCLQLGERCKCF